MDTLDPTPLLRSPHVQYVQSRLALLARDFLPLTAAEVRALEANGNSADDWQQVRKTRAEPLQTARVRQCAFHGRVVLGRFSTLRHDVDGVPFACGLYNSALSDALVLDDALVKDTLVLRGVLVDTRAAVVACGSVVGPEPQQAAANGRVLHVGVETGGRHVRVVADLPFSLAAAVATRRGNAAFLKAYDNFVDQYVDRVKTSVTIVAPDARVRGCSRVQGCFVGDFALVEDCDVSNSTILSTKEEPTVIRTKCIVRDSIVQWNSTVEAVSVVEGAFLCDTSHVERQGIVMSSVIGPNTSIAEGEVTSSLVGPFVGFHHQALLIASIWPSGRGNIGYGANVGSNHTLKAPDQELFHGEGVFFGLGCNVKFPSNFVKAPYSVIATAVNTLPQLVTMPFALINTPAHVIPSLSPAINEISPGWVLSSSVFTVLRNEDKFRSRNKSKRTQIEAAIFRPEIVQYMKGWLRVFENDGTQSLTFFLNNADARAELEAAQGKAVINLANGEAVYTDKQVRGLGKNYMRESSRRAGITAYSFFIKLYAAESLLLLVESGKVSPDGTVGNVDSSCYELVTLAEEFEAEKPIRECLSDLVLMRSEVAKKAADGKARDDVRGQRIIPDYADVHELAAKEGVVLRAQRFGLRM
ncbi:unnamed protein product [Phytophthora lilii]|uniref:Unnamed protein product n=1 Tax=Phytophthora lilii TaxID=2077276 RepID=A0A9W6U792_9STRA|nr:unnamed protein product [Phytophthora lilii]